MVKLYDLEIERILLSSIFYDESCLDDAVAVLKVDDFYSPIHQDIFMAMIEFSEKGEPIDDVMLLDYLQKKDSKKDYESEFVNILGTAPIIKEKIEFYIKIIKDYAVKRKIDKLSNQIKALIEKEDSTDVIDKIQTTLYQISMDMSDKDFKNSKEVSKSLLKHIEEMTAKEGHLIGLDTGFSALNKMTSGFNKGDLIILAARPSMGKTAFALNIANQVLDDNKGVAIFSLEMPAEQLLLRMVSAKSKIPLQNIREGNMSEEDWSQFSEKLDWFSRKDLYIDDTGELSIHALRAKLKKLKTINPNISLAIVDYLQLMESSIKERHLAIAEISRGLKLLARELEIPIIALSQLNRSLESRPDKKPMMSDLRESGAIEQDADIILFIYRGAIYEVRELKQKIKDMRQNGKDVTELENKLNQLEKSQIEEADIIIAKHRNGPIGEITLLFNKPYTRFENKLNYTEEEMIQKAAATPTTFEISDNDNVEVFTGLE